MFQNLNTHSIYSKMSGTASIDSLIKQAKKFNQTHLALTEVNGLWGFIHFVQKAKDNGILPIAGTNLVTKDEDVVLLAENQIGYSNICFAISKLHDSPNSSMKNILQKYNSGVFVLSHKRDTLLQLMKFIPNSHLFIELRPNLSEGNMKRLSKELELEMVVTSDAYFLNTSEHETHKILRAIDKNTTISQLTEADYKSKKHYFYSEKVIINLFPNSLNAINNSHYLAERCKTDWSFVNTIFPGLSLKETHSAGLKLRKLIYYGAKKRYEKITDKIKKRIEYELSIIIEKGFAPYFLIVWDIVKQTNSTIGRGSGASSIVSYCLFITQVDPIKYNLQFERFIHPQRFDMPDIDIDFPWDERDGIIDYIFKKYGNERTAMVSNQVFMQARSTIREVSKVYGLSNEEIKSVTKRIGYQKKRMELIEWIKTDKRFQDLEIDETLIEIIQQSEKILGAFRNSSVHPGGVIIVPDKIRKFVPVLTSPKGVQIVEWEKDQVEDSGLLKIDILGNRSLAVVRDTIKQIGLFRNKQINYHKIKPVNDNKTEALMKAGKTMGVFYIESPATRQLLQKAGKVDFEHVVIYSSIIRPAANRYIDIMLERIHGKKWKLLHRDLKCLSESYGIMVYEEQVSMVARKIAGFNYVEGDYIRKVISKSSLQNVVPLWKKKFISGATRRGYSKTLAITLWNMIRSFSGYSFCKAHSASYAILSFTCGYLKANYTAEFLASVISNQGGYYSAYAYLSDAKRFKIKILKPHINFSERKYKGKKDKIRMGFMSINKLQKKTINKILNERKNGYFKSLKDFMWRVDLELADAMSLTNAGCFSELEKNSTHKEIAFFVAEYYLQTDKKRSIPKRKFPSQELTNSEKINLEIESFGFPISVHPLERYLHFFKNKIKKAKDISKFVGKTINLAGVYITRKVTSTKKHQPMEFITFEDETDIYECVMFPEEYKKYSDLLLWEKLFIIRGKVEVAFGVYTITVQKLGSLQKMISKL